MKMSKYIDMVRERKPLIDNIIGFMDCILFPAEFTNECIKQNAYYSGYDYNKMVNNVFAYGPISEIFCGNQLA